MKLKKFLIEHGKITIKGEVEGYKDSGKVVIFAHGFGVKRDSKGMFLELGDRLKEDLLVVRFDFNEIVGDKKLIAHPYDVQAKILNEVINYVKNNFVCREINLIAHSAGCLVVGILSPTEIKRVILNSPPIEAPYKNMIKYFSTRSDTHIDEYGQSILQRSDGSITEIGGDFWKLTKNIKPIQLYKRLSGKTNVFFVKAVNDQILKESSVVISNLPNTKYYEINSDHDFSGKSRQQWLDLNAKILNS